MSTNCQPSKLLSHILHITILLSFLQTFHCCLNQHTPYGMDYELRRPITYLYNRLALKFDFNPYTSHLIDTQSHCSSRTGPYCGFINGKRLMEHQMILPAADQQIHKTLLAAAQGNWEAARQIEKGELDAFLISGELNKKFDQTVKKYIEKDFYDSMPSHKRARIMGNLEKRRQAKFIPH